MVDTEASLSDILKHSAANYLFGLTSGLVIAMMILGNLWLIALVYLIHKKNEVVTIPRMQYKSKLGRDYLYPLPSTAGFISSYLLAEYLKTLV